MVDNCNEWVCAGSVCVRVGVRGQGGFYVLACLGVCVCVYAMASEVESGLQLDLFSTSVCAGQRLLHRRPVTTLVLVRKLESEVTAKKLVDGQVKTKRQPIQEFAIPLHICSLLTSTGAIHPEHKIRSLKGEAGGVASPDKQNCRHKAIIR